MSYTHRRCQECGLLVEPDAPSCPECGGTELIMGSGPSLADLVSEAKYAHAQHSPFDDEPMVRCSFCQRHIEAAEAYHSRNEGLVVCWECKQAEEG